MLFRSIEEEVPSGKLYRTARVVELADHLSANLVSRRRLQRSHILARIDPLLRRSSEVGERFLQFLSGECSPGMFTDLISHWAPIPPTAKQDLLFQPDVDLRLERLAEAIEQLSPDQEGPSQSGFSVN